MPAVSIIVPSYNHARFIPACVESVLAQTFSDWELIVVDDGSTDDSVEVWRSYSDPRIQVFQNERNLGTYGTQNRAVSLASSDLISVLNSDDFWGPEKLRLQVSLLQAIPSAPFCFTRGNLADESGNIQTSKDHFAAWPQSERFEVLPYLLEANDIFASSVLWRRKWAEFATDYDATGDWIAAVRASYYSEPCCVLEPVTFWRQHGANTSQKIEMVTLAELQMRRSLLAHRMKWNNSRFESALVKEKLGRCALHLCALEMLWHQPKRSRAASRIALALMSDRNLAIRRALICRLPLSIALKRLFPQAPRDFSSSKASALAEVPLDLVEAGLS